MEKSAPIIWTALCVTCGERIDSAPNGQLIEGAGKRHVRDNPGHKVLVGYNAENPYEDL